MSTPPNIWRPQRQALELLSDPRRVLPFVGAGLDIPAGMPSGPGLAEKLRTGHALRAGKQFDASDNLIQVASTLAAGGPADRKAVADYIIDLLDIDKHGYVPPTTLIHLVRVPSRWYVTTTYDLLPELAAEAQGIEYQSFTWKNLPDADDIDRDAQHPLYIVHLHGCVTDQDSLILDAKSYHDILNRGDVHNFLHLLFHEFRACFLGTALDEPHIQAWMLSWWHTKAKHVLVDDEASVARATQGRGAISVQMQGIAVESFPSGAFHVLDEFCEFLVTRPAATETPLLVEEPAQAAGASVSQPSVAMPAEIEVRYVRSDWGPDWTRRALKTLGDLHPEELLKLQERLGQGSDPKVVEDLIRRPEDWMQDGSAELWVAAARFAEQQGDWQLAREAWETAAQREGADRVEFLVSASVSAELAGDADAATQLLEAARDLDPEHPRVRLQDVNQAGNLDEQLDVLRELWDDDGDVGALAHAHASLAYVMRGEFEEAERHVDAARRIRPDTIQARIVAVNLVVHRSRMALFAGRRVEGRALIDAKEESLALRDELMTMRRWTESVRLLMLAADATGLQWQFEEAGNLLLTATDEELESKAGRIVLADAALRAQQHAVALELLNGVRDDDSVRAMRATAEFAVGDEHARRNALRTLDGLLSADEDHVVYRAAIFRVTHAHEMRDMGWPDAAERVLVEQGEQTAVLLSKAIWLYEEGDVAGARELLEPHAGDVRVVEFLLQLAIWDKDEEEAARVAANLLALGPDNITRLRCARALWEVGDLVRAKAEATVVADDQTATPGERGEGLHLLGGIAADVEHDYQEALDFFEKWEDEEPLNEGHIWARLVALIALTRHTEALRLLEETHAAPRTLVDARVACMVYARMEDPIEALRRVSEVIDRAPEPDAELERQLQLLALHRAGNVELPEDLAARIQPIDVEALGLKRVSIDALRELAAQRASSKQFALKGVMDGELTTMVLAAAAGRDIGALWMRMPLRPLGFGSGLFDAADRRDAETALVQGAVIDPTALFTFGGLGAVVREPVMNALAERGRVAQSTLNDLDHGQASLLPELTTGTRQELHFDPQTGQPIPVEWSNDVIARDHERGNGMLALAHRLRAEPDVNPQRVGPLDALLEETTAPQFRALIATLSVAQRLAVPVYSDDPGVRALARQAAIATFGTTALLDALYHRGDISQEALLSARQMLRANGFIGVTPTVEELVALLDEADGEPSDSLRLAFHDQAPWRAEYGAHVGTLVDFLRRVLVEHPVNFDDWVTRVLDAMVENVGLSRADGNTPTRYESISWHAQWLLTVAWAGVDFGSVTSQEFLKAFHPAVRHSAAELGAPVEPILGTSLRYAGYAHSAGITQGPGLPVALLGQLPVVDVMRLAGVDPLKAPNRSVPTFRLAGTPSAAAVERTNAKAQPPSSGKRRRGR